MRNSYWIPLVLIGCFLIVASAETSFPCADDGSTCTVAPGVYTLPASTSTSLLRLLGITSDTDSLIPFARSYNGAPWERVGAGSASAEGSISSIPPVLDCTANGDCSVTISNQAQYSLSKDIPTTPSAAAQASRLLQQATFGPDAESIASLAPNFTNSAATAVVDWIQAEVSKEPTLHRAYYRERANPRLFASIPLGGVRTACLVGSRWNRYAFTTDDIGKTLSFASTSNVQSLFVDGILRTEGTISASGRICSVEEHQGGAVTFDSSSSSDCSVTSSFQNPPISFSDIAVLQERIWKLANSKATFSDLLDGKAASGGSKILESLTDAGKQSCDQSTQKYDFLKYRNTLYKFDPRLLLLENTLSSPATGAVTASSCPVVPKTFLNKHSCRMESTCAPLQFSDADIVLNDQTLAKYYSLSHKYVYRVSGLRLEDGASPCAGVSRWRKSTNCRPNLDTATKNTLKNLLRSRQDTNQYVRDIEVTSTSGTCTSSGATGPTQLMVDGICWEHTHADYYSVYDFTSWAHQHDGNPDAMRNGNPNPITKFAQTGSFELVYPSHHPMSRWNNQISSNQFAKLGRYGDTVEFKNLPTVAQTSEMAAEVNSVGTPTGVVETCGSPGEVSNKPEYGHRYKMFMTDKKEYLGVEGWNQRYDHDNGQRTAWTTIALNANDQLRQRVSWALSQIFVISESGFPKTDQNEVWHNYYDIFVSNSFENFRDILQQVSWSPVMAAYLTFLGNRGLESSGTFPDENYAREIMQLFTIGLHQLNMDGTPVLDSNGAKIPTYDNDDIMTIARAWTGFDKQPFRSNIEAYIGKGSQNWIDPMTIKAVYRDMFPKLNTLDGYIGDGVPLCRDLPSKSFLMKDAVYQYVGSELSDADSSYITLQPSSALHTEICRPSGNAPGCTRSVEVVLASNLVCSDVECNVDTLRKVKLVWTVNNAEHVAFYHYQPPACAKLAFFEGQQARDKRGNKLCAHKDTLLAGAGCCATSGQLVDKLIGTCEYQSEHITYKTLEARCAADGKQVCSHFTKALDNNCKIGVPYEYGWTQQTCSVKAQVDSRGFVSIVHSENNGSPQSGNPAYLNPNTKYAFQVPWKNGAFPKKSAGCATGCVPRESDGSCLCDVVISETDAITPATMSEISSQALTAPEKLQKIEALLQIGSVDPAQDVMYSQVSTSVAGVVAYYKSPHGMNTDTIFKITSTRGTTFWRNKVSTVQIGTYQFRNPPHLMTFSEPTKAEAEYETEKVIDHFFHHPNTAPFISRLLIQRLVTSNPSPRYIKVVAEAFSTGKYDGSGSGKYGDLLATVHAILRDREASSPTLDADPAHGKMREPLVKLLHFMRAMKYTPANGRQEVEMSGMEDKIGEQYALSPTVFNYYLPDYQPMGKIANAEMFAPEAELGTAPYMVGFLNGMTSLIKHGLTDCDYGFASDKNRNRSPSKKCSDNPGSDVDGILEFAPTQSSTAEIVDELALLLTAGRLNSQATNLISAAYDHHRVNSSPTEALKVAMQLMMISAEFHATNLNKLSKTLRAPVTQTPSGNRKYKAVVVIFLGGGADSFNMVVPHSKCGADHDLYEEYKDIRGDIAIPKNQLLEINVLASNPYKQPCQKFGLHPQMPFIKELYQQGDATILANIGALVEPVTKQEFENKEKELPPNLFAHNFMQKSAQTIHAQYGAADGVLGRIVDELGSDSHSTPFKTASYSIEGNVKMLEGSQSPAIVNRKDGVIGYTAHNELNVSINEMLTGNSSESYFADTYTSLFQSAVATNQELSAILASDEAILTQTFETDKLSQQLEQVAKLTKTRSKLDTERAAFFVRLGGFDSHGSALEVLKARLEWIDAGLRSFVQEMKDQGIWNDVTIVTQSDFGRTLTSNGQGNDHAWGGHNLVLGGSVDGKKILGKYPEKLGEGSDLNIGRGRILPTTGWESVWFGLSEWMGVQPSSMATILPNAARFTSEQLFSADMLFQTPAPTSAPTVSAPTKAPTLSSARRRKKGNNGAVRRRKKANTRRRRRKKGQKQTLKIKSIADADAYNMNQKQKKAYEYGYGLALGIVDVTQSRRKRMYNYKAGCSVTSVATARRSASIEFTAIVAPELVESGEVDNDHLEAGVSADGAADSISEVINEDEEFAGLPALSVSEIATVSGVSEVEEEEEETSGGGGGDNDGLIIGLVVGLIGGLLVMVGAIALVLKYRTRHQQLEEVDLPGEKEVDLEEPLSPKSKAAAAMGPSEEPQITAQITATPAWFKG